MLAYLSLNWLDQLSAGKNYGISHLSTEQPFSIKVIILSNL
jgi:hypothetical protein